MVTKISKEELDGLVARLPQGSREIIARRTGYSKSYVNQVLSGKRPVTARNCKILAVALKVAKQADNDVARIKEELTIAVNQ